MLAGGSGMDLKPAWRGIFFELPLCLQIVGWLSSRVLNHLATPLLD